MLKLLVLCVASMLNVFFPVMQRIQAFRFFKWIDPPTSNSVGDVLPVLLKKLNNLDIENDTLMERVIFLKNENVKYMDRVKQLENEGGMKGAERIAYLEKENDIYGKREMINLIACLDANSVRVFWFGRIYNTTRI
jgi:hypothetical protein